MALVAGGCSHPSSKPVLHGASLPSTSAPTTTPVVAGSVNWIDCGGGFQCGSLLVPLDYSGKTPGTIPLELIRLPAADKSRRIGSLLINPGGPGASGVQFARRAPKYLGQALRDRFDIVGFDPRGVGQSEPVRCADDPDMDRLLQLDFAPGNDAERAALAAAVKAFDDECQRRSGRVLPFVSTRDAAHDIDLIRQAVGDQKLTYLGESYGTFLGAMYASEFPTHVRALALDGVLDPAADEAEINRLQSQGFEQQLRAFLADCASRPACQFQTGGDPIGAVTRVLAGIDQSPLPAARAPGNRKLGHTLALIGIVYGLYSKQMLWRYLEQGLAEAQRGDGSTLLVLADAYTDRHEDGSYEPTLAANAAVNCLDQPFPKEAGAYEAEARSIERVAPTVGRITEYLSMFCAFWPVPPTGTAAPLSAPGAPPILVVGTTHDPATPYVWAERLAKELGSGVLLTRDGDGHTAYSSGNSCIDAAVEKYLIDLVPPAAGARC
jgi:pimeloyl-ACP methyl ester carboxylesterase